MLLKTKLCFGAAALILLLGGNSAADWLFMKKIHRFTEQTKTLERAKDSAQECSIAMLRFLAYHEPQYSQATRENLMAGTLRMRAVLPHIKNKEQAQRASDAIADFGLTQVLFYELEKCITNAGTNCDPAGIQEQARLQIVQLLSQIADMTAFSNAQLDDIQTQSYFLSVSISILALLLGAVIMLVLLRAITQPVASAIRFAETVAQGDFTARWQYTSNDEMGKVAVALNNAFAKVSEQAQWYESILDSIPNVISVTDNEMRWTFLNKACLELLEKPRAGLLGKPCSQWGSPACGTEECGIVRLGKDPTLRAAHTVFTADNKTIAAECSYLMDSAGTHIGHVTFRYDITESENLRKEAEAASRAKSAFLAAMSHEIRTPINAIMGFTHLFARDNLSADQINKLDKIRLASKVLLEIVNDILNMADIETGNVVTEVKPFSLAQSLRDVMVLAEEAAQSKQLCFTLEMAENIPDRLHGDAKHLRMILLNLTGNAVKFTEQGEVHLRVNRVLDAETAEDEVVLTFNVADTGIGISNEQLNRLFIPFSQVDTTLSRRFGGTGLGLYISQQLVELMGGNISVTSQLGHGTTFCVRLPFGVVTDDNTDAATATRPQDKQPMALQAKDWREAQKRVLVVEDNEINQEIAVALLEACGLTVEVAAHGQEALQKAACTRYDAIFMDMQMPVMDGLEATRRLREKGNSTEEAYRWLRHVPIIAMTANALLEDRQLCLEAGMNDHTAKPIDPNILHQCLQKWL